MPATKRTKATKIPQEARSLDEITRLEPDDATDRAGIPRCSDGGHVLSRRGDPLDPPPGGGRRMSAELTCLCGTPLVRDGVVVCSHWTGAICASCEQASIEKHTARLMGTVRSGDGDPPPPDFGVLFREYEDAVYACESAEGDEIPVRAAEAKRQRDRLLAAVEQARASEATRRETADELKATERMLAAAERDLAALSSDYRTLLDESNGFERALASQRAARARAEEQLTVKAKEHYDLIDAFEREFRRGDFPGRGSLEREAKDQWARGSIYQHGEVNALFLAYRRGYALGKAVQRDASGQPEAVSRDA